MFDPATIWVLIPIAAIAAGAFREWVKFKSKQRDLGRDTDDLERALTTLESRLNEQQATLERRIANLETIITSQTWDLLHDNKLPNEDKRLLLTDAAAEVRTLREELGETQKAELLARRLK